MKRSLNYSHHPLAFNGAHMGENVQWQGFDLLSKVDCSYQFDENTTLRIQTNNSMRLKYFTKTIAFVGFLLVF
jgi:hypothetical protein